MSVEDVRWVVSPAEPITVICDGLLGIYRTRSRLYRAVGGVDSSFEHSVAVAHIYTILIARLHPDQLNKCSEFEREILASVSHLECQQEMLECEIPIALCKNGVRIELSGK